MIKLSKEEIDAMPDFIPVVGFEGHYEVGKDGSVWSLKFGKRKQLKPGVQDNLGHLCVSLWKE